MNQRISRPNQRIFRLLPAVIFASLMASGCNQSSPTDAGAQEQSAPQNNSGAQNNGVAASSGMHDARIVGQWLSEGWGTSVNLAADGSGTTTDKAKHEKRFTWESKEEAIIVSKLSGEGDIWPPSEGEFDFVYRASDTIPGAAFLTITQSVQSGQVGKPQAWDFERK